MDSKKLAQTIGKMEDAMDRIHRRKTKEREEAIEKNEEIEKNGGTEKDFVPVPKAWSDRTNDTYKDMMKSFIRDVNKETGFADMKKIVGQFENHMQKRLDKYHAGERNESYNVKTLIAAVKAYNEGVMNTVAFSKVPANREKFVVQNVDVMQKHLKETNVIRHSGASKVLTATGKEVESVLDNIKNNGRGMKDDRHDIRKISYVTSKLQYAAGGRITNTLKVTVAQVKEVLATGKMSFIKDKGGLSREVIDVKLDAELRTELTKMIDKKSDDTRAFIAKKMDGKFLSINETRKKISRFVKEAGKHLTREETVSVKDRDGKKTSITVTKEFSTHSFRKAHALQKVVDYLDKFKTREAAEEYIKERSKAEPKIWSKYKREINRLNRDRNKNREMTRLEMAYYMTSVDLGHFRLGIIENYYAPTEMALEHYQNTFGEEYEGFGDETKRGR
ncbi:hypothetical protein [Bacillus toyonensis]|uniref:hypothetical protein n=1 Tax=Bacillus toyonensis TaxID=155322 RepID=UPI000BFC91AA|nr:hypothetical protein [Bacillus toyonensis]PHE23611.1 hypothetical protein COF73_29240 [Bacillus toyonensis]